MGLGITKSREVPEGEGSGSRKDLKEFDKLVDEEIERAGKDPAGQVDPLKAHKIQDDLRKKHLPRPD